MKGVYLLHFEPRFKHAGHYIGYADDLGRRIYEHEMGQSGARLTTAAVKAGCRLSVVRVWPGMDRDFERSLKGRGRTGKAHISAIDHCPCCKKKSVLLVSAAMRLVYSDLRLAENFGGVLADCLGVTDGDGVQDDGRRETARPGDCRKGGRTDEVPTNCNRDFSGQSELDEPVRHADVATATSFGAARSTFEHATDKVTGEIIHFFQGEIV